MWPACGPLSRRCAPGATPYPGRKPVVDRPGTRRLRFRAGGTAPTRAHSAAGWEIQCRFQTELSGQEKICPGAAVSRPATAPAKARPSETCVSPFSIVKPVHQEFRPVRRNIRQPRVLHRQRERDGSSAFHRYLTRLAEREVEKQPRAVGEHGRAVSAAVVGDLDRAGDARRGQRTAEPEPKLRRGLRCTRPPCAHFGQARRFGAATRGKEGDDGCRANARSAADWNLRAGSFSRQRRTIRPSAGGTEAGSSGGSSFKMAFITSTDESPAKARLPQSIS